MFRRIFMLALALALVGPAVFAQQTNARIIGTVTDPDGNALPGVAVEATSPKLVGKATAVTDENGVYRLLNLTPGVYSLAYELEGFNRLVREGITLSLEQTLSLNVSLKLGVIKESVVVTGQAPLIDVKSTARGMTLSKEAFKALPKGRNFDSLMSTIPSVVQENNLLRGASVDGASGDENMYYIDGVNTNNLVNGTSAQSASFDFVEEVQVKSSGYQAEYGGSMGGVINVVSRSGGNEFHGDLIGYYSGSALTGKQRALLDYNDDQSAAIYVPYDVYVGHDKDSLIEGGFNLGGYFVKDKLWFFASVMPSYQKLERTMEGYSQAYRRKDTYWNGMLKLTANPVKNLRLGLGLVNNSRVLRGSGDLFDRGPFDSTPIAWTGSPTTDYNKSGFTFPNHSVSLTADLTLGNNTLIAFRGGYFMTDTTKAREFGDSVPRWRFRAEQPYGYIPTTNTMFPEIPANLVHRGGWQNKTAGQIENRNKELRERYNANLDINYFMNLAGEHSWKAGFQLIRQGQNVNYNRATGAYVLLAWDMDLVVNGINYGRGTYGWYAVRGNDASGYYGDLYNVYANNYAAYIQDSWTIGNRFTVNFGLRAENEYLPSYSSDPQYASVTKAIDFPWKKKLAPRLGFVWDVRGDSSLKLYGSFGIFYDMMKLDAAANAYGGFKWKSAYYTLDSWDYTQIGVNNNYPGTHLLTYDYRPPNFDGTDPDIKPFSMREFSFGAEKKLGENISFSARLVNKHLLNAIEDAAIVLPNQYGILEEKYYTINPGSPYLHQKYLDAVANGTLPVGVPDVPKAKREYWALNLSLEKRFSDNWMGGISYTWSRLTGNYSGLVNSDEDGRNSPNAERGFDLWYICYDKQLNPIDGPLATDRPHVFKAYGSYVFPFGLTLGGVVNAMSGTPTTTYWLCNSDGYMPYNRNDMGRTPFLWFANLYAEYNLKLGRNALQFSVNVDNLFNVRTAQTIWNDYYLSDVTPVADTSVGSQMILLSKNWNPPADATLDPAYGKGYDFFAPISVRLGFKFSF